MTITKTPPRTRANDPRPWWRIRVTNPTTGERLASTTRDTETTAIVLADQWAAEQVAVAHVHEMPAGRLVHTADPFGLTEGEPA